MADDVKVTRRKITDYQKDPDNANRGRERGHKMVKKSFDKFGAGRSGLADADNTMIAGNHALEGAIGAGIEDVIEVETDGSTLVIVKRTDLRLADDKDKRARELALADNRTGDVNLNFDVQAIVADPSIASDWFRDDEIDAMLEDDVIQRAVNDNLNDEIKPDNERNLGNAKKQIKPVLYVDEVSTFEQALRLTGIQNRGQAVLAVCRYFIEHHGGEDGQDDPEGQ